MSKSKRPLTPTYVFFYILFWPDTWRILIGLIAGGLLAPKLMGPESPLMQTGMIFVMIAAIGYAASGKLGKIISLKLRKIVLKDNFS